MDLATSELISASPSRYSTSDKESGVSPSSATEYSSGGDPEGFANDPIALVGLGWLIDPKND